MAVDSEDHDRDDDKLAQRASFDRLDEFFADFYRGRGQL